MAARVRELYRRLGRFDKAFLLALLLYLLLSFLAPASGFTALLGLLAWILGIITAFRWTRRGIGKLIWRLRNRLIVAYLFIAVIPILLILLLVGIGLYGLTGQTAVYLVQAELNRRSTALRGPTQALARTAAANRPAMLGRLGFLTRGLFPQVDFAVRQADGKVVPPQPAFAPPEGFGETSGVVVKDGRVHAWAHADVEGTQVTLLAPLTRDFLAELVPGLGDVFFLNFREVEGPRKGIRLKMGNREVEAAEARARTEHLPPKFFRGDIRVTGVAPVPVSVWEAPGRAENAVMVVHTRTSALLRILFGQSIAWRDLAWTLFLFTAGLFLLVELISVIIGIRITRTITGAVHELYQGTERIKEGDFAHRVAVRGNDQLAELTASFNTMTANIEKLIVVAKEKERLQSEIEIAREVQTQLFPRNVPELKTLRVTGACHPARMVSGDYYDFVCLQDGVMAFAIGDVAGKGISAALLMAAIQSTMRTQLSAGAAAAGAAAGNGGNRGSLSAAYLVGNLNKQLYANTSPEKYATFYFSIYDDETGLMTYTNAGHLPPILVHGGDARELDVTGTVVGAFPFARYEEKQVTLASGDLLVAYTDGITEPENEYGEMFGEERLKDLLVRHAAAGSDEVIARVMEAVNQWTGSSELQDDMTMIVARRV